MIKNEVLQLAGRSTSPPGYRTSARAYRVSATTGLLPAELAADSVLYSQLIGARVARAPWAFIERVTVQWTVVTAFSTPVTAGRHLRMGLGDGTPSGGTTLVPYSKGGDGASLFQESASPADIDGLIMIASTAALGDVTVDASAVIATVPLAGFGAAGSTATFTYDFSAGPEPVQLIQGTGQPQNLIIYPGAAMDAGGTFQLTVDVDWLELPNLLPIDAIFTG